MSLALVTGTSSGIGKELAREFAKHGYDLVLVGRDAATMAELANTLTLECKIKCHVISQDLSQEGAAEAVFAEVHEKNLEVTTLVNNAGFGVHGAFAETSLVGELSLVRLQIETFISLTKLFLPAMRRRKSGSILNVASVYAFAPVPFQAVYGASKAFMASFSDALATELKGEGIHVTLLCPGSTKTGFRNGPFIPKGREPSGMSAVAVAKAGVHGLEAKKAYVIPGLINKLFFAICFFLTSRRRADFLRLVNRRRLGH